MALRVSRVRAVVPFEPALYEGAGVPVEFVGHPLLDVLPLDLTRDEARRRLGADPGHSLIGLLPGSRAEGVEGLLSPAPPRAAGGRVRSGGFPRCSTRPGGSLPPTAGAASCWAWRPPCPLSRSRPICATPGRFPRSRWWRDGATR